MVTSKSQVRVTPVTMGLRLLAETGVSGSEEVADAPLAYWRGRERRSRSIGRNSAVEYQAESSAGADRAFRPHRALDADHESGGRQSHEPHPRRRHESACTHTARTDRELTRSSDRERIVAARPRAHELCQHRSRFCVGRDRRIVRLCRTQGQSSRLGGTGQ